MSDMVKWNFIKQCNCNIKNKPTRAIVRAFSAQINKQKKKIRNKNKNRKQKQRVLNVKDKLLCSIKLFGK